MPVDGAEGRLVFHVGNGAVLEDVADAKILAHAFEGAGVVGGLHGPRTARGRMAGNRAGRNGRGLPERVGVKGDEQPGGQPSHPRRLSQASHVPR